MAEKMEDTGFDNLDDKSIQKLEKYNELKTNDPEQADIYLEENPEIRSIIYSSRSEIFLGPLPAPEILKQYNEIDPDIVDRILVMAEEDSDHNRLLLDRESRHRQELENKQLENFYKERMQESTNRFRANMLGRILAFIFSLIFSIAGVYLIVIGKDIAGYIGLLPPLAALITTVGSTFIEKLKDIKEDSNRTNEDENK